MRQSSWAIHKLQLCGFVGQTLARAELDRRAVELGAGTKRAPFAVISVWMVKQGAITFEKTEGGVTFTLLLEAADIVLLQPEGCATRGHWPQSSLQSTPSCCGNAVVGRLTPDGQITEFPLPFNALDIADGPDGNIWVGANNVSALGRVHPDGTVDSFPLPSGDNPSIPTVGPDGNLWMAQPEISDILRVDTAGQVTGLFNVSPNSTPSDMTSGSDNALWFVEFTGNQIGRITTDGSLTELPVPTPASHPGSIAAGLDGNIWFAERYANQIGEVVLNQPPTAHAGGPYTITYGTPLMLDASASTDPDGDALTYTWTINGHTQTSSSSPTLTLTWPQLAALGVAGGQVDSVSVLVDDGHGFTDTKQTTLTVNPAPLTVSTNSSLMLVGTNPPPLTGSVNGTPFTGSIAYTTSIGDTITITLSTTATSAGPVGPNYLITASLSRASSDNYVIDPATSTTGTMYVVSLGADPGSPGAQAVTFWDNKGNAKLITAADLSSLDALNLVTQNRSPFDPTAVRQLQAWLSTPPNASTAYLLAVQLAVMDLNVLAGYVQTTDLVFAGGLLPYATADYIAGLTSGGFIDVQSLMQAANTLLGQLTPGAPSNDPNQPYETALIQVLQVANGNTDFVRQVLLWTLLSLYSSLPPAA
jgi:streptogramin lyase